MGPDEPRYAQIAREMLARRELITPTLAGHTWFEKPVLLYWMMEAAFALIGISEASARLGPALCGLLTVVAGYLVGRRVETLCEDPELRGMGLWSALALSATPGIIVFSRAATFDIVITMALTWALSLLFLAEIETNEKRWRRLLAGFYIFIGISLLAKGLIGLVLPFGIIFLYQVLRRRVPDRKVLISLWWGLPLAVVVAAIWFGPVIARHGWTFVNEFFIQHHFARYVSNKYGHPQPVFYYLVIIFPLALPWLAFAIDALRRVPNWNWRGASPLEKFRVFMLAWILFPFVFFSFSGSKLPAYILPILPALALLGGERLTRFISGRYSSASTKVAAATLVIFAAGAIAFASMTVALPLRIVGIVVAPLFIGGVLALWLVQHKRIAVGSIAMSVFLSFVAALNFGASLMATTQSSKYLLEQAAESGYGAARVYLLHDIDREVEFYAAGRVAYDNDGQPIKFEGVGQILAAAAPEKNRILVIVPVQYLYQFTDLDSAEAEVIAQNGKLAIVGLRSR